MADISATIKKDRFAQSFQDPVRGDVYNWNPVGDGTSGAAAHDIVSVADGEALLDGYFIVTEAFDSAGDGATVQFELNTTSGATSDNATTVRNLTAAIGEAELTVGRVIPLKILSETVLAGTATAISTSIDAAEANQYNNYVDGTAVTECQVAVTVAGEALTAGKGKFFLRILEVGSLQLP